MSPLFKTAYRVKKPYKHVRNVHKKDCTMVYRTLGLRLQVRCTTSTIRKDDGKFAERVFGQRYKQINQYPEHKQRQLEPIRINNQTIGNDGDSQFEGNNFVQGKNDGISFHNQIPD